VRDEGVDRERDAAHAAHTARETSDLSAFDLYFVCLHVANLCICAENAGVSKRVQLRFQRILDEVIAEYDAATVEQQELQARFDT
jgi:hypothetical protein